MRCHGLRGAMAGLVAAAALVWPVGAAGQEGSSFLANALLTGYGTINYAAGFEDDANNDFSASFSPIVLYRMGDDFLFEAEIEFGLEGAGTELELEYAQLDYLGFERVVLSVGKFLLPFGVFGERVHPSWINRLPTMPLLYGHAHGGVAEGSLLPLLSDVGVMARLNQPVGTGHLDVSLFVTQGPQLATDAGGEEEDHDHGVVSGPQWNLALPHDGPIAAASIPDVAFGTALPDNNDNKLLGARLGFVRGPSYEFYASGFHAMYDSGDFLDLIGLSLSGEVRPGAWTLMAEGAWLRQEFDAGANEFHTLNSPGFYVLAARRFGALEPVLRWSQLLDAKVDGQAVDGLAGSVRITAGLDYWMSSSVPVKLAYEWSEDFDDRVLLQWAFGF